MKNILTPHQIIGYFFPGFIFQLLFLCSYFDWRFSEILSFLKLFDSPAVATLITGIAIIVSAFIGFIIDAVRNGFIEDIFDGMGESNKNKPINEKSKDNVNKNFLHRFLKFDDFCYKINWDYFSIMKDDEKEIIYGRYYSYYVFDMNASIGILINIVLIILFEFKWIFTSDHEFTIYGLIAIIILSIITLIFLKDSASLRHEIYSYIEDHYKNKNPHESVFTRIKPSPIVGVGVFAILNIPKGTYIFKGDNTPLNWLDSDKIDLELMEPEIKKIYKDFCIEKNEKSKLIYGCPTSFNNMTISWFLNHSKSPNVICDCEYNFYAARDIKIDEELTVDYSTYGEINFTEV